MATSSYPKTESTHTETFDRPSAGYSITLRLKIENRPGAFAKVCDVLGDAGVSLSNVTLISSDFKHTLRDVTVHCRSEVHAQEVVKLAQQVGVAHLESWQDDTFEYHRGGKISVQSRAVITNRDQLSRAYTPGVARVCMAIHHDEREAYNYTIKGNMVAVVSDGSAVLGLGNIGAKGALPVMEGKAMLFKQFANVDAFPICLDTQDTEEIIRAVKHLAPVFGGINLEDISSPRCFEIEERLREELDIPVFHDDQHGTAVVALAGVINALKIVGKKIGDLKIVVNGFGASGVACTRMLLSAGARNIIPCDTAGSIYRGRTDRMNAIKEKLLEVTNPENFKGTVHEALRGADMFLGVSSPGVISRSDVEKMAKNPIIFALANPTPEIMPDEVKGVARVVATGRSDYANQVNNALCFPGLFRGALDARATQITEGMKLAAAMAIAQSVPASQLNEDCIIPGIFEPGVAQSVAHAVFEAAKKDGVAAV